MKFVSVVYVRWSAGGLLFVQKNRLRIVNIGYLLQTSTETLAFRAVVKLILLCAKTGSMKQMKIVNASSRHFCYFARQPRA